MSRTTFLCLSIALLCTGCDPVESTGTNQIATSGGQLRVPPDREGADAATSTLTANPSEVVRTAPAGTVAPELVANRTTSASIEQWPRWRGPRGDGTWQGPKLLEEWPEAGLRRVWRQAIGGGYAGVVVAHGRVYTMDYEKEAEEVERVLCFDAATGEPLWAHPYAATYGDLDYGNGPRSAPTVHDGHVYTLGAVGHVHCLDAATGEPIWSRDLVGEHRDRLPEWGLAASPVVFENLLIVHAAGEPEGCLIALDRHTGEEAWRGVPDLAGYATPVVIEHEGNEQLVCWNPENVRGVDPRSGRVLWTIPFKVTYNTSIATPIFRKGLVLVSNYWEGTKAIRLGVDPSDATVQWEDGRNLRGLMSQPLYRDGYVYLLDKRHGLTCFRLKTGEKIWDDGNRMTPEGRNPQATLVWIGDGDRAIALNSEGDLILARLNPTGYHEQSRTNIIGPTWAHPAYAGERVYARNDTELICVSLIEAAAAD